MSERALHRKLRRIHSAYMGLAQERSAAGAGSLVGAALPNAREILEEQQDRRREALAERLLEIMAEEILGYPAKKWAAVMKDLGAAALAGATVLYPELPEPESVPFGQQRETVDAPVATTEGYQAVAGEQPQREGL